MERQGVSPAAAKAIVRSRATVIAALMVERGEADAMICGMVGRYQASSSTCAACWRWTAACGEPSAMTAVINDKGVFFFARHPRAASIPTRRGSPRPRCRRPSA